VATNGHGLGRSDATASIELLLLHPMSLSTYPCRVTVDQDGIFLQRLRRPEHASLPESPALLLSWRSLHGLRADESDVTPAGTRLQVVEFMTDDGVLSVLASAVDTSRLLTVVERWSGHWRRARSSLVHPFAVRRKRSVSAVA
jgi:hypothetical protein